MWRIGWLRKQFEVLFFRSTCDTVHCPSERALFSASFFAVFWRFPPLKTPVMIYNICYWWFFLSQWNRWTKYLCIPKYWGENLTCWCLGLWLLWTDLTCCCPLSWQPIWFHIETVTSNALNRRRIVVFDRLWENAAPTLNTAFSLTNFHAKCWIYCLLIYSTSLLSPATSIYDWPKRVWGGFFFCVFRDNCRF